MADSDNSKPDKTPRRFFIITGCILLIAVVFIGGYVFIGSSTSTGPSEVQSPPRQSNSAPGANTSDYYANLLEIDNKRRRKKAVESDNSYVPTVGGSNSNESLFIQDKPKPNPVDNTPEIHDKPDPQPEKDKNSIEPTPTTRGIGRVARQPDYSSVNQQMKRIMKYQKVPKPEIVVYHKKENKEQGNGHKNGSRSEVVRGQNADHSANTTEERIGPKVGSKLYARVGTALNSDQTGPVAVTVVAGKFKGAQFLGGFTRHKDKLVVKFDTFVPENGPATDITAYAVSPDTSSAAIATAVNHHYLSRWAALLGSAFLEGLGRAVQQSGSVVTRSIGPGGTSAIISRPDEEIGNQALQALGKVGKVAGQQAEDYFDRPPTVKLAVGAAIGVLVIQNN